MNVEATIHTAFWFENKLKVDFQMVSVLSQLLESEDSEVLGITKRIRQTLRKEIASVMATKDGVEAQTKSVKMDIESVKEQTKDEIKGVETRV
jgi:hypothetical protein